MAEVEGMKRLPPVKGKGNGRPRVPYKCLSCGEIERTTRSAQSHKDRCTEETPNVPESTPEPQPEPTPEQAAPPAEPPTHEPQIMTGGWTIESAGKPGVIIEEEQPAADDEDQDDDVDDQDDEDQDDEADAGVTFGHAELAVIVRTSVRILEKRVTKWDVDPLDDTEHQALEDAWVPVLRKILTGPHAAEWSAAIVTAIIFGPRIMEARKNKQAADARPEGARAEARNGQRPEKDVDDLKRRLKSGVEA